MLQSKQQLVFLIVCMLAIFSVPGNGGAHDHLTLEGLVITKDNSPVGNVWVRIYRGGEEIGDDITSAKGRYAIEFAPGDSITTVRFDHLQPKSGGRFHPVIMSNLSGKTDHVLNKTLPAKVGFGYSPWDDLELVSSYQRIYALDKKEDLEGLRKDLHSRYAKNITMWKPTGLAARHLAQVKEFFPIIH